MANWQGIDNLALGHVEEADIKEPLQPAVACDPKHYELRRDPVGLGRYRGGRHGTRCVPQTLRAAGAYRKKGVVNPHAELVTGVSVPFRTVELTVGEMMEQDALYLCMDNAARPLLLLPLAQLRRRSDSAQDTCFFHSGKNPARRG
jgi:hypothetical protein